MQTATPATRAKESSIFCPSFCVLLVGVEERRGGVSCPSANPLLGSRLRFSSRAPSLQENRGARSQKVSRREQGADLTSR